MTTPQEEVINTLGLDGSRKGSAWRWILLGGSVVAAVVLFQGLRQNRVEPTEYVTAAMLRGPLQVTVTATGTLQPTVQVEIGSEVSGIIEDVFVNFNDAVTAGQIIAQLDTQTLEARLASSQASLAVAQAALAQAEASEQEASAKARRSEELITRNLIAQQNLETDAAAALRATASVQSAQAQVTSAGAALEEARTALAKAVIRAPIDGIIISREVDPGQTVAAAFQTPVMFIIAEDLQRMELHLDIDESDIGQIRQGQQAKFRVDAYPDRVFDAEISSVRFSPREVNNIVTYETVLTVNNPELLLRPGMTATADILVEEKHDALQVSNQALRFLPSEEEAGTAAEGNKVWIVQEGKAVPISVIAGLSNGEVTEIIDGAVQIGTEVIVDIVREARRPETGGPF